MRQGNGPSAVSIEARHAHYKSQKIQITLHTQDDYTTSDQFVGATVTVPKLLAKARSEIGG